MGGPSGGGDLGLITHVDGCISGGSRDDGPMFLCIVGECKNPVSTSSSHPVSFVSSNPRCSDMARNDENYDRKTPICQKRPYVRVVISFCHFCPVPTQKVPRGDFVVGMGQEF